ncbi:NAC domain-containing protein JA2L-like [Rhododendron vialii]|uniref:NAC domain-containing protein JA2L-like n=1 Tax=Rhododendron vialii TaxID=182163 RepID=UPI00265E74D4|nr:NAC domain-containing protein JA2L-like [Rhododendron vialii]
MELATSRAGEYTLWPTDKDLLDYLKEKSKGAALPCDVVIEREIYGVGNKAPWQIFIDEDPWDIYRTKDKKLNKWKRESTIYVFTTLINAIEKERARTAGYGSWNEETASEQVVEVDKDAHVIGYKRMLCFQITNESGVMDESVEKGHWIMHEYSLRGGGGNTTTGKGEYVLCRIKRDGLKNTKISPRKGKNVEAATTDDDLIVSKPAKYFRTEFMQD